ncbi:hypothetical protein OG594_08785 [Streptomyces sp. NBC_01214]|nr:hypothetical protein [Streptomyces sp. NBC_01214]MCX4801745.1 hypothetical protein [Streptomyces sp. NBC_01214]
MYWHLRAVTGHRDERYRSVDWWDQQTSLGDLKYAAEFASDLDRS